MNTKDTSGIQIILIASALILCGLSLALYKNLVLGFPLLPGQHADVWTLESKISFHPNAAETEISFALPSPEAGWRITDENFISSGYQLSIKNDSTPSWAIWHASDATKKTSLYYKLQLIREDKHELELPRDPVVTVFKLRESQHQAFEDMLAQAELDRQTTASTLTSALIKQLSSNAQLNVDLVLENTKNPRITAIQAALAQAEIPTQVIRGVYLEDGRRRQQLSTLLASFEQQQWRIYDIKTGVEGLPENFFVWRRGDNTILDVVGGRNSNLEFAIVKNSLPLKSILLQDELADDEIILDISIYSLPVEQQGIFKTILLIPVGALVVALLRILVGLRTSGTFMPILISLALIETTLLTGIAIFLLIISVGLWIRSYLSYLNLLLVARVAAVVIVVILLMAGLSIGSYKMGIDQALTVTFFPTIILSWTIERMSILWEEEGGHEVLIQGGGSLLAAVMCYFVISNNYVEHLTFNFPELLISLLGCVILLGNYSGYRLMELYRFREFKSLQK